MSTPIQQTRPFAIRKIPVSPGGAGQVTEVTFPGATAGEVITIFAETASLILQEGSPAEGSAYNDDLAFPIPINGYATFPVSGWGEAVPRVLLASLTMGAIVRIMVAKQTY